MQLATAVKTILCALILLCSVVGADAFDTGKHWSVGNSIPHDRSATVEYSVSALSSLQRSGTPSCADPAREDVPLCHAIEQQILGSTVRIEIEAWISRPAGSEGSGLYEVIPAQGNGHGTVMDGRYLITHNHFDVPLLASGDAPPISFGTVTVYAANGETLALRAQPASLSVMSGGEETLELDFGLVGDVGFFAAAGLTSAQFKSWQTLPLRPGTEVAQIDWDGKVTRVQWTIVETVVTENGVPRLVLSNGLARGASGGGVFWRGYHVANNWSVAETVAADGAVRSQQSIAALNAIGALAR